MILWLVWVFPDCSGAATEDGVIVSSAGRDKTSSKLGVELGIKVNLHTPRICEENVPRDGYGSTCWSINGEMRCRILLRL